MPEVLTQDRRRRPSKWPVIDRNGGRLQFGIGGRVMIGMAADITSESAHGLSRETRS